MAGKGMKTVREWFQELPNGIRELALENLVDDVEQESLSDAIWGAFVWMDSPEGHDFWITVFRASKGNTAYPEPPKAAEVLDGDKISFLYEDEARATGLHFESPKDPIVEKVVDRMRRRSEIGLKKYGTTLANNPAKLIEWVNHAQEEVMDLALYLERIKQELSESKDL